MNKLRPAVLLSWQCWLMMAIASLLQGCSSEPPLYPVTGQVVFKDDGRPFAGGTAVVFESKSPPYHRARGDLDKEGRFELKTEQRGDDPGAMEGPHRVSISYISSSGNDIKQQLSKLIHPRYFEFQTSGIECDIKPGQPNDFKIELERP
jgi:hypothetical protein